MVIKRISIESSLDAGCKGKIERQLNFVLASVHWQILQLEINLQSTTAQNHVGSETGVRCELSAKLRGGRCEHITVHNKEPLVCVGDAAARLRRVIARDRQLGLLGRVG